MTTYKSIDSSVKDARPLMLIEFADEFGTAWRYNTGTIVIVYDGDSYAAERCSVGQMEMSSNNFRNSVDILLSRDNAFAAQFISGPLESRVTVTVYRFLVNDSGGDQYQLYWSGVLQAVSFDKDSIPKCKCDPKSTSIARLGKRRICQVMCDVSLYSTGIGQCSVSRTGFALSGVVDTIVDSVTFQSSTFSSKASNWLQGGEFISGNAHRLILNHTGNEITINRAINDPDLDSGGNITFTAYAGCDHTQGTCLTKFSNKINYAGLEYLPTKNPFIGDAVV